MHGTLEGGVVHVGGAARERFYDTQGYGRPRGDALALAPVEAAHLLERGDLEAVDGLGLSDFLTRTGVTLPFVVYRDLRERGFYLSPGRWADEPRGADLVVYPRGKGPWDDAVAFRIRILSERTPIPARDLDGGVLAVVDEDGELTYFETSPYEPTGTADVDAPSVTGTLLDDRVLVGDPPDDLHDRCFFGQRLGGRGATAGPIQLSLVEAAYLTDQGILSLEAPGSAVGDRGRAVEGDRFDRRLHAYTVLRDRGVVPKSGFKFGADFRCYESFETVDSIDHSDLLVRVVAPDHEFVPRDISLDVRLASGVRKRTLFALTGATGDITWVTVDRLTP